MPVAYDIDLNFSLSSTGDISVVEDKKAIDQSIKSILFSSPGHKKGIGPVNEFLGIGLKSYLFAPLNEFVARSLAESISRQLTMFEPRIEVDKINVIVNTSTRAFEITIQYIIVKSDQKFDFKTVINQL